MREKRVLPAGILQPENEQLPQGNRRLLWDKEKSDHACRQAHFRNHCHARQQCPPTGCVNHARPRLHTHDTALRAGYGLQPENIHEPCERTAGAIRQSMVEYVVTDIFHLLIYILPYQNNHTLLTQHFPKE